MKKISFIIATTALIPLHLFAQTVPLPQLLNFDGQLLDSSNNPIASTVPVVFEIFDGSGTPYCLLYKETQSVTPNAIGEFSVKIGPDTGNASPADDGDLLWPAIFSNNGQVRPHNTMFCNTGYTPAAGHARKLRVTVNGFQLTPDFTIAPVPMATVAETLQGKVANDFLLSAPASNTSVLTGNLRLNNNFGLQLTNTGSTNFVTLRSPAGLTADYSLLLPMNDGNSGEVLSTDGNGVLSWIVPGGGGAVTSVFGRTGAVVSAGGDYTAGQITSTAVGNIAAVNVQAAIAELESEKISTGNSVISSSMLAASAVTSSHINDGTITGSDLAASTVLDGNLTNVSINKLVSGTGQYLTYAPGGTACADGEIMKWNLSGTRWQCATEFALPAQTAGRFLTTDGSNTSWSPNLIQVSGNIGIGTIAPGTILDVAGAVTSRPSGTGAGQTGQLIMRELAASPGGTDTVAIRAPDSVGTSFSLTLPVDDGNAGQVLSTDGNGLLSWITPLTGITLSGLNGATAANTIANANYTQTWNWDALTTQTGMSLGTTSQTSGTLLSLVNSYAASTGNVLKVVAMGAGNAAVPLVLINAGTGDSFRINDDGTDSDPTPFIVDSSGSVGIGTLAPSSALDVKGTITSRPWGTVTGQTGRIILRELMVNGSNFAAIRVPDVIGTDYTLTLPATPGTTGQLLQTDGSGLLSWTYPAPPSNLDFSQFANAMTLDASTDIVANGANVLSITNTGTGDSFRVNDSAAVDASPFIVDANGDVGIGVGVPLAKLDVAGPVKLGIGGTAFQASGVCSIVISTHGIGSEATPQFCAGVPNITTVAVHCSPSAPVAGYITARATGSSDMIAATLGVSGGPTTLTCMWMVP